MTALTQALLYAHEYSSALSGNAVALGRLSHPSFRSGCRGRSAHEEAAEVRMCFRLNGRFGCQRRSQWFGVWRVTITHLL